MANHKQHLRKLLQTYLANCGDTADQKSIFWSYVCGWVPEPAAPAVFKENGLKLSGNEKSLYRHSYRQLRLDRAIEHVESKDLNERLAGLARESLENEDQFKDQAILNDRIKQFLDELIKPEENYKVLFAINNLRAKIAETVFWDCTLASYSREELVAWGYKPDKNYFPVGPEAFEDRNVIIISERGTNIAEIVKRARVKAIGRLRILQHYLKEELIHDEQLFFSLSKESAVKRERDGCIVSTGIDHRKSAIEYDYPEFLLEGIGTANSDFRLIKKFPANLQTLIERTLHWIGLSISEIDLDIKISYLCTALETLLTTKADQRKGERIAYRGYLLGMAINPNNYSMPQKVLRVYDLRSTVVHGSNIRVATQNHYWLMLEYTQNSLRHFVEFVDRHSLTKPSQVYAKLLQSSQIIPFLIWLKEGFDDDYSRNISTALTEDWLKSVG